MVDCPNCGTHVAVAVKCWTVSPAKHTAKGDVPEFRVGIFECPSCTKKFRSRVAPEANSAEVASIATLVAKLEEIRQGLTQSLRVLHEKMKTLETEQPSLLDEVARFKKTSETRASVLEAEVNELREELRSLREFLGASEERV